VFRKTCSTSTKRSKQWRTWCIRIFADYIKLLRRSEISIWFLK
jgi:hypothetical protein